MSALVLSFDKRQRGSAMGIHEVGAGDPSVDLTRSALEERIDELNNKLASVIANAELVAQIAEGPARERAERLARCAWSASEVASTLMEELRNAVADAILEQRAADRAG